MDQIITPNREFYSGRLKSFLRDVCPQASISMDAEFVRDLGVDSIAMMTFILRVEEEFGVVIGGKELEDNVLLNLSSLLAFLLEHVSIPGVDTHL